MLTSNPLDPDDGENIQTPIDRGATVTHDVDRPYRMFLTHHARNLEH
jgi:hypothetical protein